MFFSEFAPFGMLQFSSDESEGEKIYKSMVGAVTDPRSGLPSFDLTPSPDNYEEGKIYGTAMAFAAARMTLRRAHAQLRPETSYEQLPAHENRFGVVPGANDTIAQRRERLKARQMAARGPRRDVVDAALRAILGENFIKYRTISPSEAVAWPSDPAGGPGSFPRPEVPARMARLRAPVSRNARLSLAYDFANASSSVSLNNTTTRVGQVFFGNGEVVLTARFRLRKTGSPAGHVRARVYPAHVFTGVTGEVLATSAPVPVSSLGTAFGAAEFEFRGPNRLQVVDNTLYAIVIECEGLSAVDTVDAHVDTVTLADINASVRYSAGAWTTDLATDVPYEIVTSPELELPYENWNPLDAEVILREGDEVVVGAENIGLAEKAFVRRSSGTGAERRFAAAFANVHDIGASAVVGPMPIWRSTKRCVLVVVKSTAAVDSESVRRIDEELERLSHAGSTWAIVQPSSPGASTLGPFTLGASPLGAVPIGTFDI